MSNFKFKIQNKKIFKIGNYLKLVVLDISADKQHGQALVMLLLFMVIAVSIMSGAIAVIATTSKSSSTIEQGYEAYSVAESGAENALLRILRDPSYSGETLQISGGTAIVQVSSSSGTFYATSSGTLNNAVRKIQVTAVYNNSALTVQSWQEIF